MTASKSPALTDWPAGTLISRSTPFTGAGTSSTTLSVSRSARFSSRLTASPGCLRQAMSVASATDSGSCGTRISTLISFSSLEPGRRLSPDPRPRVPPRSAPAAACCAVCSIDTALSAVSTSRRCSASCCFATPGGRRRGRSRGRRSRPCAVAPGPAADDESETRRPGSAALPGTRPVRWHWRSAPAQPDIPLPGTDIAARCARSRHRCKASWRRVFSRSK